MKTYDTSWTTSDQIQLYARGWEPETPPRAVICLVHGIGEHCGRYEHVAEFFTTHQFAVLSFDLRGHGKSSGQRGHTPSFEALMSDIDLLFQEADRRFPGLPRFLYGHSLGGALVLNYTLRRKPQVLGVVAASPGLRSAVEEQKLKVILAKIGGLLAPTLSIATGLDANTISRDSRVIDKYNKDPLVHGKMSLGMGRSMLQATEWVFKHAAEFPSPLLIMHGSADALTYPRGSQEFASLVSKNCTLKLWEGLAHETHNEPEKAQVLAYVLTWLELKLSNP